MEKQIVDQLFNSIIDGRSLTNEEALKLLAINDKELIYDAANKIRAHFSGKKFDLCTITNAKSGKCQENCKWCAQSAFHKTNVEVYDLIDEKTALEQARQNAQYGVNKFSLVTSGRRITSKNLEKVCGIYKSIGSKTDLSLCASMGLLDEGQLKSLKEAGVKHYHCNLETAPSFFPNLCTSHSIEEKIKTIQLAQKVGLEVCSGGIIGMGESMEQRIELAFTLKEIGVKSIPINILNPIEGTPLQGMDSLSDEDILMTFALFRFINPDANIRFAGGRNKIRHLQERLLKSGVNAALVGDLLTTIGTNVKEDLRDFSQAGFSVGKSETTL
ncbi:MAG: biotin synthase BioB [Hyphomicrobiales bacterium]